MADLNKSVSEILTYEQARDLARSEDKNVRKKIALNPDTQPEILYYLTTDEDPEVRRAVALNAQTPGHADMVLVKDGDQQVRGNLAHKIAKLAPGLSSNEQDKIRNMIYQALEALAHDHVIQVRQTLSDTLQDIDDAPREIILKLAMDVEKVVSDPVLEFSPVLTDEDLLQIIKAGTAPSRLSAIASRKHVTERVVDAIVDQEEEMSIALLLGNQSAQIREVTLNWIIDRARDVIPWHYPLANRPVLPAGAALRMAGFVSDNLLKMLSERKDIDPQTIDGVREILRERLKGRTEDEEHSETLESDIQEKSELTPSEQAYEQALQMQTDGTLTDDEIEQAIDEDQQIYATATIAVRVGFDMSLLRKVFGTQSAKMIVAICWKAGLEPQLAEKIQIKLANMPITKIMRAEESGEYALSADDMEWQFEFASSLDN